MSVSKWAYIPDKCDGDFCCGNCDDCPKADDNLAILKEEERPCNDCKHYKKGESGIYGCEVWECCG